MAADHQMICGVDGVNIIEHVTCPEGWFNADPTKYLPASTQGVVSPSQIPLPGDILEAALKRVGADRLAKWWEKKTGKPCGCDERRLAINAATIRLKKWLGL